MAVTQKAKDIARDLEVRLAFRLPTLTLTRGFDTDNCPWFHLGDDTAGAANILVKVVPETYGPANPITGSTASVYVPHIVQVVTEANSNDVAYTPSSYTASAHSYTQAAYSPSTYTAATHSYTASDYVASVGPDPGPYVESSYTASAHSYTQAEYSISTYTAATHSYTASAYVAEEITTVADCLTPAQLLAALGEAVCSSCTVEWYNSDFGDSPDLNDITSGKLVATFRPFNGGMMASQ